MKTTFDLPSGLLAKARQPAQREGTTGRELVEEGLRQVVTEKPRRRPFRLRKASFKGRGLRPELEGAPWERLREFAHAGRGG